MTVMKFGGASLASPSAIEQVAAIVRSEAQNVVGSDHNPVVVVSAIGDTTDRLLEILACASRGESYLAWKLQEQLKTHHFCLAEDLLSPSRLEPIDNYIRLVFRDLHVRMLEVSEGERAPNPELRDWVASLGEKLSSRIVAAVLEEKGIPAKHMDSEKLILTDANFTNAKPRYWETYARIRWSVPMATRSHVVVIGGFIGATEDGRTTTLGRGGSDLTATIVGAATNAGEVQVWKSVDGMLTWSPKVRTGGLRLKSLSYDEASDLARAGAEILHPETIAPARRLRIPVVIRNTFHPHGEGTRIGIQRALCATPVKSIVCKTNMTVIELRSPKADSPMAEYSPAIERICREQKAATFLAASDEAIYLGIDAGELVPEVEFPRELYIEARVRNAQAVITLVGEGLRVGNGIIESLSRVLAERSALILPANGESCSVQLIVAQEHFEACTELLQNLFFMQPDAAFFAPVAVPTFKSAMHARPASEKQPMASRPVRQFVLSRVRS